ncbi:MAG: excinuclease ABC subunit UvrB [Candidatus Berkelbacteria bacterium]|nr:excinuclease ABC subunit UvrB [Candidatus Berkelbacteria bacterium]
MEQHKFKIHSKFQPAGDQPEAILQLSKNLKNKVKHQTLWGITGSGKTFTMANVIEKAGRPTLIIAHNKTLAAQLADEFREYFPENAVHYFVSYYDYYQPEAYIPQTDTYIEKDSSINDEIDRLRHAATHALLTRSDVIIVASVSCIYGIGSPEFYLAENFQFKVGESIRRDEFLKRLNILQYDRNDFEIKRGAYRLRGDLLEILPAYANNPIRVEFFGNNVERITEIDWITGAPIKQFNEFEVFPATHFLTPPDLQKKAIEEIGRDLKIQVDKFKKEGKFLEAERIEQRTNYDLEMITETGTCSGIENYSRYFDGRTPGEPSTTLIDYFPKDLMMFIDESHITVSQIGAMFEGDRSRKDKLVEFGFRLPSAYDNRPLRFPEFAKKIDQVIYVSATPGEYELRKSSSENSALTTNDQLPITNNAIVRQFIRPTGLLDPIVELRKSQGQIEDLISEIDKNIAKNQRVLVTTLTKKMAEELSEYLAERQIKVAYLHSDIETFERLEILHKLRLGKYDVVIGINLLREGLDLPEVSLVAILDADKEGFLRSKTSLIQTMGRAARHSEGRVIMYANNMTKSMEAAISETQNRRKIQEEYNQKHDITPISISKNVAPEKIEEEKKLSEIDHDFVRLSKQEKKRVIAEMRERMQEAAKNMEFERAAELRDEIIFLESKIK